MTFRMILVGGDPTPGGAYGTSGPIAVTATPPWFTTGGDNGSAYTESKLTPAVFKKSAYLLGYKIARAAGAAGKVLHEAVAPQGRIKFPFAEDEL